MYQLVNSLTPEQKDIALRTLLGDNLTDTIVRLLEQKYEAKVPQRERKIQEWLQQLQPQVLLLCQGPFVFKYITDALKRQPEWYTDAQYYKEMVLDHPPPLNVLQRQQSLDRLKELGETRTPHFVSADIAYGHTGGDVVSFPIGSDEFEKYIHEQKWEGRFDYIIMNGCPVGICTEINIMTPQTLRQMAYLLKPGGLFLMSGIAPLTAASFCIGQTKIPIQERFTPKYPEGHLFRYDPQRNVLVRV